MKTSDGQDWALRKRPIAAAPNNANDPGLLMEYFKMYKSVISSANLIGSWAEQQWDRISHGYSSRRLGDFGWNWTKNICSKFPDNRESLTALTCALVTSGLENNIAVTTTKYLCNESSILIGIWPKNSKANSLFSWWMVINRIIHVYEFLKFCEYAKIKAVRMPLHTTHLFQPRDGRRYIFFDR